MKKLIWKLFLLGILFAVPVVFAFHQLPKFWGNPILATKLRWLDQKRTDAQPPTDKFFLGSSMFWRQINPVQFDTLTKTDGQSFNLACRGVWQPETAYLLDNLSVNPPKNLKYLFAELSFNRFPKPGNLLNWQGTYFLDWKTLLWANRLFWAEPTIRTSEKLLGMAVMNASFIKNATGFGLFRAYIDQWLTPLDKADLSSLGKNRNGFYPLEEELADTKDEKLVNRQNLTPDKKEIIASRYADFQGKFKKQWEKKACNKLLLGHCKRAIERYNKLGINLIYVVSPRDYFSYPSTLPVLAALPPENRILLADPEKYPSLFTENSFDTGHLNDAGAAEMTRILAEEFLNLQKN